MIAQLFGGISLDEYISGPISYSDSLRNRANIKEKIKAVKRSGVVLAEEAGLKRLYDLKAQTSVEHLYPKLNLKFLSMSNKVAYKGVELTIPKFSVYNIFGSTNMNIVIYPNGNIRIDNDEPFKSNLLKAIKIIKDIELGDRQYLNLESNIDGFIPVETKKKIKEAKRKFGKRNLYFIAETKPESWNVRILTEDPLVVGVLKDRCYLIDKFNTTNLEEYVSREFTN